MLTTSLPREVLNIIFEQLDVCSLINARQTCVEWRQVGLRPHLERTVSLRALNDTNILYICYQKKPNGVDLDMERDQGHDLWLESEPPDLVDQMDQVPQTLDRGKCQGLIGDRFLALFRLICKQKFLQVTTNVSASSPFQGHISEQGRIFKKDNSHFDMTKTYDTFKVYNVAGSPPRLEGRFQLHPLLEPVYANYSFELDRLNRYAMFYHDRQIRIYDYYPGNILGDLVYSNDMIVPEGQWIDYASIHDQLLLVKIKQGPCFLIDITTGERIEIGSYFQDANGVVPSVEATVQDHILTVSVYPFNSTFIFGEQENDAELKAAHDQLFIFYYFQELLERRQYLELPLRSVVPLGDNMYFGLSSEDNSLNCPLICRKRNRNDDSQLEFYNLLPHYHISLSFSHNKHLLAIAGLDHHIYVYNLEPRTLSIAFDYEIPLMYFKVAYESELTMPRTLSFVSNESFIAEFRVSSDTDNYVLFRKYQLTDANNSNGNEVRNWDIADCGHVQDARYHRARPRSLVTQVGRDLWGDLSSKLPICRHQLLPGLFV